MRFQVSFSGIMLLEESTARMRTSVDRSRSTAAAEAMHLSLAGLHPSSELRTRGNEAAAGSGQASAPGTATLQKTQHQNLL
jgi:hypothetical protein